MAETNNPSAPTDVGYAQPTLPLPTHGLYVLTSDNLSAAALPPAVDAAIQGGAVLVQYRNKRLPAAAKLALGQCLRKLCRERNVPFIVNDDVALATELDADGVHLGKDDAGIVEARRVLGNDAIIGVSCYNSLDLARQAAAMGADYVAFGRFFPSSTKPLASPAAVETLQRARAELSIPLVAIGGITPANGAALLAGGADFLAVIEGVFGQTEPEVAAKAYAALWEARR
ncbi:MAG: thiamine phosphate synthase [Methylococcaceae bacterium]|nr:MAG: thiamine phosphate synthase [Methylococcaceae bacterium]